MPSRRSFALAILCLLVSLGKAYAAAAAPGPELLRNGTFEAPFSSTGVAAEWTDNSDWAPVKVSYGDDATHAHAGQHAQHIECSSFKGGAVQFVQYGVPVEKAAIYRISAWMKGKIDAPVELLLRKSGAPYTTYATHLFRVGHDWHEYTFEAPCDESDPAALFVVRFAAAGTLTLDDISCRRVGTVSLAITLHPPASPIPQTFFGMHLHLNRLTTAWPAVPFGALRLWDSRVSWPQLEPERARWDFARLDHYLELAEAHHVEVLLPLGLTPTWASARPEEKSAYSGGGVGSGLGWAAPPRDMEDWDRYVRAVTTHCKGRVHEYEVWNEPNMTGFFTGSVDQLAELTRRAARVLQEVDPQNRLVSSSIVGDASYLDDLAAKGGIAPAQAIGFHFYVWPDPPEKMLPQIQRVQEVLTSRHLADPPAPPAPPGRPIWNTEAGWNIQRKINPPPPTTYEGRPPLSMDDAGAYIARAYILNWAAGVQRYYFYAWDNGLMGLVEEDGTLKPPAKAYATVCRWLIGARMESCACDEAGTWTVKLTRDTKLAGVIVWNAQKDLEFAPPVDWRITRQQDLSGDLHDVQMGKAVKVGRSPLLLAPRHD